MAFMGLKKNRLYSTFHIASRSRYVASRFDRFCILNIVQKLLFKMDRLHISPVCFHSGHGLEKRGVVDYKESVKTLNTLQSNESAVELAKLNPVLTQLKKLPNAIVWLACLGIVVDDLNKLNIIHISGTKGKGSTCAFTESILRNHGLRTGFYSSPHVVAVRERIRIDGLPLSENMFAKYFWEVYDQLSACKPSLGDIPFPAYFSFLTLLAFYVFLKEKVDVAIIEVGVGGQYDTTNILRKPVVCGVTSLGIDHLVTLGPTLADIAWHKAGIFKPGIPAVTVHQTKEAMDVLDSRAKRIGAPLSMARPLESYNWYDLPQVLGLEGETQRINAALAVELVLTWLHQQFCDSSPPAKVESRMMHNPSYEIMCSISAGLRNCRWPGRYHVLHRESVTYFLDGAHTPESLQVCAEWFDKVAKREKLKTNDDVCRILIFNSTGDRRPESLLSPLVHCNFDAAIFCPNDVTVFHDSSSDMAHMAASSVKLLENCKRNERIWLELLSTNSNFDRNGKFLTKVVPCISDALYLLSSELQPLFATRNAAQNSLGSNDNVSHKMHILVVGSLHLVGGVLSVLDPNLES